MKQALLYSIAPQHLANILNGLKTIEVRKRDLPQWAKDKLARGEKVVGYGYCTKGKPHLYAIDETYIADNNDKGSWGNVLNGLVVVKFEVSGSDLIDMQKRKRRDVDTTTKLADGTIHKLVIDFVLEYKYDNPDGACLTDEQLHLYGNGADLYAHHLNNIQPVNMELRDFYKLEPEIMYNNAEGVAFKHGGYVYNKLFKVPKSFQTVWVKS